MTAIHPCRLCPLRAGCALKGDFLERVRGLGLRVATFPCPTLSQEVRVGRRIVISQPVPVWGTSRYTEEEFVGITRVEMAATITSVRRDHSFSCVVDKTAFEAQIETDGDDFPEPVDDWMKKRFRRTQKHIRIIRFLNEPDWPVCRSGNVGAIGCCETRDRCECETEAAMTNHPLWAA